jgi:hypothetical protein
MYGNGKKRETERERRGKERNIENRNLNGKGIKGIWAQCNSFSTFGSLNII